MSRLTLPDFSTLILLALALTGPVQAAETDNPDLAKVSAQMTSTALAFLDTVAGNPGGIEVAVGYQRKELVALAADDPARTTMVYWPYLRKGLPIDFMSAAQRTLVHDLLNTALSASGYLSTIQIMQMEKILADTETVGFPRGPENYTLAIFGTPSLQAPWSWRFEGHHLSLNFTVSPTQVSVTPAFFGASPAQIKSGPLAGFRNQRGTHEAGLALIEMLDATQRAQAIEDGMPPFDILSGTLNRPAASWDDWKNLPPQGITVSSLNAIQKDAVQRILDEVVTTYRPEISQAYLQQIDVNELRFVWFGGTNPDDAHYYRLEGTDFFFEYDLVQNEGNHVHAVWRSKHADFGADLLLQHRAANH